MHCTLVLPVSTSGAVLLGRKARGFGKRKICGFGGKVETGEEVREAAFRELREEVDLDEASFGCLERLGQLTFSFDDAPGFKLCITVFSCRLIGVDEKDVVLSGGDEFESPLLWYDQSALPYGSMWPDAAHYLPLALASNKEADFDLTFSYETKEGDGLKVL